MPVDIQIADEDLSGFSNPAKGKLKEAVADYASDLIDEANRIEAGRNSTGGNPEITQGMVNDAKILLRRGLGAPKTKVWSKIWRVAAAVLSLAAGFLYDKEELQDGGYMLLFILVVATAILAVTISTLKD